MYILSAIKGTDSFVQTGQLEPLKKLAKTMKGLGYKVYLTKARKYTKGV